MICNIEDMNIMIQNAPALYQQLVEIDKQIQQRGFEISIRNTDHYYESFRWEIVQRLYDKDKATEQYGLYEFIKKSVSSTCCQCGSNFHVSLEHYDDRYDSSIFHNKCILCQAKGEKLGYKRILKFVEANTIAKKEKQIIDLPKIKLRLVNEDNHIFFSFLQNLYIDGGSLILSNQYDAHEKVKYAGMSLGARDINGERLYEGDLVVATLAENGRLYWGMAYKGENNWGTQRYQNPMIPNDIMIEHGINDFPSPLAWARSFKIVGNVITNHEEGLDLNRLNQEYSGGLGSLYHSNNYSDIFKHFIK